MVKLIKNNKFLYDAYLSFRVLLKYGQLYPKKIKLKGSPHVLCLKPKDRRAKALLLTNASGQQWVKNFWNEANKILTPDLALDCGVNYGEILFYPTYHSKTKVIGFEADPSFIPIINSSRKLHSSASQITIFSNLLSDGKKEWTSFYVKKNWSGGSSAIASREGLQKNYEEVKVEKASIDDLLSKTTYAKNLLLFKIDVEGYEPFVLRGMKRVMGEFSQILGCIEYTPSFLSLIEVNPENFLSDLHRDFKIFVWQDMHTLTQVHTADVQLFNKIVAQSFTSRDIILVNKISLLSSMGYTLN